MPSSRNDQPFGGIDTIDLTLSPSPPPEPVPQRSFKKQQKLPQYAKTETTNSQVIASVKRQSSLLGDAKRINPEHLRQIINTSDPSAIRNVLFDLCRLSPALTGAVVRGLTLHSTFAQNAIREFRTKVGTAHTEPDPELLRSASRVNSYKLSLSRQGNNEQVKRERDVSQVLSDDSSTQSDASETPLKSDIGLSRDPPAKRQCGWTPRPQKTLDAQTYTSPNSPCPASSSRLPLRDIPQHQSAVINRHPNETASPPAPCNRTCKNCHKLFQDDLDLCFYHPGPKGVVRRAGKKVVVYSCCEMDIGDEGCEIADNHVAESPMGTATCKRPRSFDGASPTYSKKMKRPELPES